MLRRLFPLWLWLFSVGPISLYSAAVGHDLGQGLVYLRVHRLPGDLPANPEGPAPASVIDLRYVEADAAAATALGAWLKFRAGPRSPVLVLVNGKTSPALLATLRAHDPKGGIVVISGSAGPVRPDLTVPISAEAERKAYDAFEAGTPPAALITDFPDKVRMDEASLNQERPAADGADADEKPQPSPVIDAALQRAVHLHRTLLALKRL